MYEAFYGFTQRPFSAVPSPEHYFPAESIEQARQTLVRVIERDEGIAVVVGPPGTGKTLLCQVVARHFRESMRVVTLTTTHLATRRAILQSILFELRLPFRHLDEVEMRLSLIDHLESVIDAPHGMLLIVDEAHTIPLRLLEEIRLISNIVGGEGGGEPRVRVLLAGSPRLEEHLAHPRLESLQQRIAARCYLHAFHRHEISRFTRQALDRVGVDADQWLTDDAHVAIARLTNGVPRLINQLCDHTFLLGHESQRRPIDAPLVEEAWADLQRLPLPSMPYATTNGSSRAVGGDELGGLEDVVEFGPLDDDAAEDLTPRMPGEHEDVALTRDFQTAADREHPMMATESMDAEAEAVGGISRVTCESGIVSGETQLTHSPFIDDIDDPFGGPFAQEEIVLDEYRSWHQWGGESRPRVSSAESRAFAAALALLEETRSALALSARKTEAPNSADGVPAAETSASGRSSSAFPLDESPRTEASPGNGPNGPRPRFEVAIGLWDPASQPVDDRDIILVDEEDPSSESSGTSAPRASRQEYRRLFGRLRQPA